VRLPRVVPVTSAAALVLAAAPSPSAAAPPVLRWAGAVTVATGDRVAEPQAAALAGGGALVAWRQNSGVRAAWVAPGGRIVRGERVAGGPASDLRLAASRSGHAVLAWRRRGRVVVARAARGGSFGQPTGVSAAGRRAYQPAVAAGARGAALVAWQDHAGAQVRRARAGRAFGPARMILRRGSSPAVGFDAAQRGLAGALRRGRGARVVARPVRGDGRLGALQTVARAALDMNNLRLRVAPDGGAVAAWRETDAAGLAPCAVAQRRPGAAAFRAPARLTGDCISLAPAVAAGGGGRWAASWLENSRTGLQLALGSAAALQPLSDDQEASGEAVAFVRPGVVLAAWVQEGPGRSSVLARPVAWDGTPGATVAVGQGAGRLAPDLAGRVALAGGEGIAVAAWRERPRAGLGDPRGAAGRLVVATATLSG